MIGIGMQGSGVLDTAVRLSGVECVAACDLHDDRQTLANQIIGAATSKTVATTRRYRDLLDNKGIDCVVVAVPDHWHKQIIVDACNAGKDVYCEKPMTHQVEEGFEIIEAARKNGRIVQIGSQRRSSISFAKAKELIGQGTIGEVNFVEAVLGRNSPCGAWSMRRRRDFHRKTSTGKLGLAMRPREPLIPFVSRAGVLIRTTAKVYRGSLRSCPHGHPLCHGRGSAPAACPEYGRPFLLERRARIPRRDEHAL